jgi:G3E family GTPase
LRQIRSADLILLTKIDAVATASIADFQILLVELGLSAPVAVLPKGDRQAWQILNERRTVTSTSIKAGPLSPHRLPFESWSWTGAEQVELDRLMAFARDPALNIYRLKGRFRLTDGRTILLQKVGSEIAIENAVGRFESSDFVAIGTKADFNPQHTGHAWNRILRRPKTHQS